MNEAFNHWITTGLPWVTVKAAMTLDGKLPRKVGSPSGSPANRHGAKAFTCVKEAMRFWWGWKRCWRMTPVCWRAGSAAELQLRRVILDSQARTPLDAQVVSDGHEQHTTVVVVRGASAKRVAALRRRVNVIEAPARNGRIDLRWLLKRMGKESVTSLLVEGGGEVNGSFCKAVWRIGSRFFMRRKSLEESVLGRRLEARASSV